MARGEDSKIRAVGSVAPAHLVLAVMLVAMLLLGLWLAGPPAPILGLVAAHADDSPDLSAISEREPSIGTQNFLYCPIVHYNWFPNPPVITSFTAEPVTIDPGQTTVLKWSIDSPVGSPVEQVTLEPGAGLVTVLDSYMFSPAQTTTYTLTAYNSYGSSFAQVTVHVRRPPEITNFTATPQTIEVGQNATLAWSISGPVDSLQVEPGVGDVTGRTSVLVAPTETTTYTLTATNALGSSTAEVMVAITGPPDITSFTANPDAIVYGESTELRWTISNPIGTLTLEPGVGDVTGQTSAVVSPTHTTVYTLTASSVNGDDLAQVTVDVDVSALPHELLVYDWNRPVTKAQSGFPRTPPKSAANGDWTAPVNFADGVLQYRLEIFNQPVPQQMSLQWCIWQDDPAVESCGTKRWVSGKPGTVVKWQSKVQNMWAKDFIPIDWERPRKDCGVPIKNSAGDPVSNIHGWNWSGENPDEWYPLDWRFTVVVVAEGADFSGWENYID